MFLVRNLGTRGNTVVYYKIAINKSSEVKRDFRVVIGWIESVANGF